LLMGESRWVWVVDLIRPQGKNIASLGDRD